MEVTSELPPVAQHAAGFVQREIYKLERILHAEEMQSPKWREIYAAKQALHWAVEPSITMSPYAMLADKRGDNSVEIAPAGEPPVAG